MTTTALATFAWDNDYKNTEQVRPYMEGYRAVLAELEAAGKYPYNDSFKGRIPGLAESENEDTGIYLCQTLRDLDRLAEKVAAFLAAGGYWLGIDDVLGAKVLRGLTVKTGFYMGGTGWSEQEGRLKRWRERDSFIVMPPRARSRGYQMGDRVLFMPAEKVAAWRQTSAARIAA